MENRSKPMWGYIIPVIILMFTVSYCNQKPGSTDQPATTEKEVSQNQNQSQDDQDTTAVNDAQFLVDAAETNYHEIALGQVAQRNTKNGDILALAQMMIEEHTKAQGELKALADKKNITVPNSASTEGQPDYDKLVKGKGKEFDKAYADEMVNGHEKAIEKFEMVSKNSKDADIKAWATATLPTLHKHLDHAKECQKKTASS